MRECEGRTGDGRKLEGRKRTYETPKGWFTHHIRNPEKYPDCRTDLYGGGRQHQQPRAANTLVLPLGHCTMVPS